MPQGVKTTWTSEMDALLGTVSDQKLADEWGLSKWSVGNHRRKLGLEAFRPRIKWTPEIDARLGTRPDWEIADEFGLTAWAVSDRRYKLGIDAFQPPKAWTEGDDAKLGTTSDPDLADELGISKWAVHHRRDKLGILPYRFSERVIPEGMDSGGREAKRIYQAQRRHRKLNLPNTLTYEQWRYACEYFDNCCAYCGARVFLEQDHLVPLSKGGGRTVLNIVPACSYCNSSKRVQRAHIWTYRKFGMEEGQKIVGRIVAYLKEVQAMKITAVMTTEEAVLNPKYKGLRTCRIEVWTDRPGQHFHYEVGRIEVSNDDELFDAVREAIHA